MKDLSVMLWAWAGVCAVSVVAAAVIALLWPMLETEDAKEADGSAVRQVSAQAVVSCDANRRR